MDYSKFDMKTPISVGAGLGEMAPAKVERRQRQSTYNVMAINPGHNGSVALTIDGLFQVQSTAPLYIQKLCMCCSCRQKYEQVYFLQPRY